MSFKDLVFKEIGLELTHQDIELKKFCEETEVKIHEEAKLASEGYYNQE